MSTKFVLVRVASLKPHVVQQSPRRLREHTRRMQNRRTIFVAQGNKLTTTMGNDRKHGLRVMITMHVTFLQVEHCGDAGGSRPRGSPEGT